MSQSQLYEFGPYRLDIALWRLERAGTPIPLPPKSFELLLLLVQNQDRVMGKSELMEALWPETFVEDANLTQHIYTLRKALGDQPNGKPYIETLARRGYRLATDVRAVGASPTAPAPPVVPTAGPTVVLEGERKHGTALHCTVSNAADAVERLGAAGMHELMARLMTITTEEIGPYEGVISERHADGFVAVFGAPIAHEDDARRAILAALAVRRRFRQLPSIGGPGDEPLDLQMGVHTGPLVISGLADGRHVEYSALGETLKTAGLLQQLAEPGSILVSESTRRAVEEYVSSAPAERVTAAGGRVYRVTGLSRESHASLRRARASTPLFGRQHEIAMLQRLLALAVGGRGQVVSIVGEPGMGKSRLADELTRTRLDEETPLTVIEGRCVSYGGLIPYLPIADLVRAYCAVDEADPAEATRHAIDRAADRCGLPAEARSWLGRLVGVLDREAALETVMPEGIKARTFEALRLLFLRGAARQPSVIVVEDVHWIDRTSEEFLAMLAERLGGASLLLVVTHRPRYRAPWMEHSYSTQITLSPLTKGDSAALVESLAHAQPFDAETSTAILGRGEGNPFFLEELARTLSEHGPGAHAVPETVHRVVMARIDRLADAPKQLLQTASVLGREVPLALLRRVWPGPPSFESELVELRRLEFLYERTAGDEPSYVFKHALTQDVAYDSLLAHRRGDLHLRAARALAELYPARLDDMAATLAYHYARTELTDEAVHWLMRAADGAARVYANAPRAGSTDARRGLATGPFALFPRAVPRKPRRVARPGGARRSARRAAADRGPLVLARPHVQPRGRPAKGRGVRAACDRRRDGRGRRGDAGKGARCPRPRRTLDRTAG